MRKTTVYFSDELLADLEALSKRKRRPKADLIREAVAEYVADDQPEWPKSFGMIKDDDGSRTSENVDEWLRENWRPE